MAKTELFDQELQRMSLMFKVLSHPARLTILQFLAQANACISGDISEELPLSRTTVHQHLQELKRIGLIKGEVDGVKTNYCLDMSKVNEVRESMTLFMNTLASCDNSKCSC